MFTRPRQLLLCVCEWNGKAANPALCFALVVFLLNSRAPYPDGAAMFRSVEGQVHGPVEQIRKYVRRFAHLFVVLGSLRGQGTEMQPCLIFRALLRGQLLVASKVLSGLVDVP